MSIWEWIYMMLEAGILALLILALAWALLWPGQPSLRRKRVVASMLSWLVLAFFTATLKIMLSADAVARDAQVHRQERSIRSRTEEAADRVMASLEGTVGQSLEVVQSKRKPSRVLSSAEFDKSFRGEMGVRFRPTLPIVECDTVLIFEFHAAVLVLFVAKGKVVKSYRGLEPFVQRNR